MQIFISYRRNDAPDATDRLAAAVVERFGEDHVFLDIDSIEIGADFATVIGEWVARCDVLLAIIGREWIDATGDGGVRRLDNPSDYVRLEIEAALERNVRVVPALVHGAQLPPASALPESLQPLLQRNAVELTRKHWDLDVEDLLTALERFAAERAKLLSDQHSRFARNVSGLSPASDPAAKRSRVPQRAPDTGPPTAQGPRARSRSGRIRRSWVLGAGVAVAALAAGGVAWALLSSSSRPLPVYGQLLTALHETNGLTGGRLPAAACRQLTSSNVVCANPNPNRNLPINTVSFQTYTGLPALYDAYTSAVAAVSGKAFRPNFSDCSPDSTNGERSWNHNHERPLNYSIAQLESSNLNMSTQAAGRLYCGFARDGAYHLIWTQNTGNLLAQLTSYDHGSAWLWWVAIHHNIPLPDSRNSTSTSSTMNMSG